MSSNISSITLQSWRERPPSSYSIKFNIFSQLESSTQFSHGKYQSSRFSSGDYKWRMIIYPKGNDKDNGGGFISMYVEIDSTSLISATQNEVYADIRFFVFNKKENEYYTIQDLEAKPFNMLRTMWGFSQVLPLDTFNDRKNGYIFDGDHCEFGVDIFVTPPPTKWEILSFDVKLPYPKFSWSVKKISELEENLHTSNSFSMGEKNWVLRLYPNGFSPYSTEEYKWLSILLFLADGEFLKEDEKIYVEADLKVKDPRGSNHLTSKINWWFDQSSLNHGWRNVSLAYFQNIHLDNEDTLKVEIEFKVLSTTKYSPFYLSPAF